MSVYGKKEPEIIPPRMAGGTILSYNPQTDLYQVRITGYGSISAIRALQYGSNKPYPVEKRVVCLKLRDVEWVILGLIPDFTHPPTPAKSPNDTIADRDAAFRQAVGDKYQIFAASAKKFGSEIHYEGDSALDNDRGSFVKLFENGDIWGLASYLCFFLFSSAKNLIFLKARDAILDFTGFVLNVKTDTSTKKASVGLDITGDQTAADEPDMQIRAGSLGGLNLFEQLAKKTPSSVPELILPNAGGAGATGALPTESASVSDTLAGSTGSPSQQNDGRVFWWLLGGHALAEVDNAASEVRLSRVKVKKDQMTGSASNSETDIKQFRLNEKELALQWKDRWVSLNDTRVSVSFGDNYVSLDDKKASLVFGDNFIIVNKNGVQIKGFLELVGGKIKLVDEIQGKTILPAGGGVAEGAIANMDFSSVPLPLLDLTMSLTVNKLGLVNETFLPRYDADMMVIKNHQHITTKEGSPTAPIQNMFESVDQPTASSSKSVLTSKIG